MSWKCQLIRWYVRARWRRLGERVLSLTQILRAADASIVCGLRCSQGRSAHAKADPALCRFRWKGRCTVTTSRRGGSSQRRLIGVGLLALLVFAAVAASSSIGPASAVNSLDKVDAKVVQQIAANGETTFWAELTQKADLSGAKAINSRAQRGEFVLDRLQSVANQSQAGLRDLLSARGVKFQPFYIVNAIRITAGDAVLREVADRPEVERILPTESFHIPKPTEGKTESKVNTVEWNVADINAPQVWSQFNDRGEDIVVASIDTGVEYTHSALVAKYRGNLGGGNFDHNYNWWDPSNVCPTAAPCDNVFHGTHTMGTMVGDDGDPGTNQVGVAPHAQWIEAKGCETNNCTDFALLSSAQFILAPTDLSGNNPDPTKRPDIVNNSWGGGPNNPWFHDAVAAWVAAGIFPAFSNGNAGPGCGTAGSPADYENAYGTGAFDINHVIAAFSSRGPSAFDGGIKPNISAPGVNVRSSVPGNGYASASGTSMAAPHVSGTVALMWSVAPALRRDIAGTEAILNQTAIDTSDLQCGGTAGNNNVFGEGRLDALAAVNASPIGQTGTLTGTVTNSSNGNPIAGATVHATGPFDRTMTTDANGHYSKVLPVGTYTVTVSAFGFATKTIDNVVISDGQTTTLNFALDPSASVTLSGTVKDGSGHGWPLYARIDIAGRPGGPIYTDPVTGHYSVSIPANATYSIKYTATLPGYQVVTDDVAVGGGDTVHNVDVPILASCTAPGYQFNFTPALTENFNSGTQPPGWVVTDEIGAGEVWAFNNPGGRGNLTGGDGAFAVLDSDHFGPGHTQDSSLVSPVVNLSSAATPVVRFNEDYLAWPLDTNIDVDVSTDGGATWQNAFHNLSSRRGPRETTVSILQAANQSNVKVRWRYRSTFGFWWEVDNAFVGNRSCDPIPGGLVVGNVFDTNTSNGLNGATVTSDDKPAEKATTAATPDDSNNPDGYYQMFSSLTGSHPFTASKSLYQSQTKAVNVAADNATRADFSLAAGLLTVTPTSLTKTQVLGSTTTATLNIKNIGTARATFNLSERQGTFQILAMEGSPLVKRPLANGREADPGWLGDHVNEKVPGIRAAAPDAPTWSNIAPYPSAIMDNAADQIDGTIYSVGGFNGSAIIPNGYAYDTAANSWSPIANMPVAREKPGAGAIGGKLYVSGGWDTTGTPIANTGAYDPANDTWTTVAANPAPRAAPGTAVLDDKLYLVGGCADSGCTPSSSVVRYDPAGDSWETLAPYPHAASWESCGGIDGKVYCAGGFAGGTPNTDGFVYDPGADSWSPIANMPFNLWGSAYSAANGQLLVVSGLTGPSTITNQGLSYDPSSDSWSALPNAQLPRFRGGGACGFYKLGGSSVAGFSPTPDSEHLSELDQCGVTDVPWLALAPTTATLQPGQSIVVTVTLSATTAAEVTQPGTYTAQILVGSNTPTRVDPVNVTMNVTPPKGWGKIAGVVTGVACNGNTSPLQGAQVQANGKSYTFSLLTDKDGKYALWAPSASNPFTLIASKDKYIAQIKTVSIKANKTATVNFALQATGC
jgi:N-acetylneuraminic acid mutarotase